MNKMIIRHILGLLRRKCHLIRLHGKWSVEADKLRNEISPKSSMTLDEDARYLILMPHSDDEWIGCSQIITKQKNVVICNMCMRGGNSAETYEERFREAEITANKYAHEIILVEKDKVNRLVQVLLKYAPNYILLPFYFDWHPAHVEVMHILHEALSKSCYNSEIIMYQVSVPIPSSACNLYYPMSKQSVKQKWTYFEETYKTQRFMPIKRFIGHERINGGLCNAYAAEVYSCCDTGVWQKNLCKMILDETEIAEVKGYLNSITHLRVYIDKVLSSRNYTI